MTLAMICTGVGCPLRDNCRRVWTDATPPAEPLVLFHEPPWDGDDCEWQLPLLTTDELRAPSAPLED